MKSFAENLNDLKSAPYHSSLYKRLNAASRAILDQLAAELAPLELHERERKINRLYIDDKNPPKNHRIMIELLGNANARCYFQQKDSSAAKPNQGQHYTSMGTKIDS